MLLKLILFSKNKFKLPYSKLVYFLVNFCFKISLAYCFIIPLLIANVLYLTIGFIVLIFVFLDSTK